MPSAVSIVFLLTGALLCGAGYLVRFRGMTYLLAGYDADSVADERGLARWAGGCLLGMGAAGLATALGAALWPGALDLLTVLFVVAVVALTAAAIGGGRRFMRRTSVE